LPPFRRESGKGRHVLRGSLLCSAVDPGDYGVDLFLRETTFVRELAVLRVGKPGRHYALNYCFADRSGPWPRVFVGEQWHRGHFTGAMTGRAVAVQNRRNVFRECD